MLCLETPAVGLQELAVSEQRGYALMEQHPEFSESNVVGCLILLETESFSFLWYRPNH